MSEEHNSEVFLRPRFKIDFEGTEEQLLSKFKRNLSQNSCEYSSKIVDNHIFIDIPEKESHYWSPHLHLEIIGESEKQTWIKGLFTPKPQVWTLFIFLHLIIGVLFFVFLVMWYVRWSLHAETLIPIIMIAILPLVWIGLYFFGRWGRKQGKIQIEELHQFLLNTLTN